MPQAGSKGFKDEKTGDEVYDDLTERGPANEGRWRPPYGLIALVCALFLVVGFGSGFGAGWAAKPDEDSDCNVTLKPADNATANSTGETDTIRPYVPMSYMENLSNDALQLHYEQMAVINPALDVISLLVSTLAGKGVLYTNQALRVFIFNEFEAKQDTIAKLYDVAQRLQRSDFDKRLYNISTGFVDVIAYIRDNQNKIGNSGRRLFATGSAQPLAVQLLKAFVKNGLNAPELKDARERLEAIWTTDELVDLAVDLSSVVSDFASRFRDIAAYQEKSHPDQGAPPQQEEAEDVDVSGKGTFFIKVSVPLGGRLIIGAADDPLLQDPVSDDGTSGRRLLQDLQVKIPLPAGFTAAQPASSPNVLIPTVWHVFMYRNADGTMGPPGVEAACDMIVRLLTVSNFRLLPSKFQLYMKECRNDPVAYPYLLRPSRDNVQACTKYGYFYENCGDPLIRNSIGDFPRSINVYVAGEEPDTPYVGYGWVPGSAVDPYTGHLGLTFTSISTSAVNSRNAKEAGATSFVHEVLHHLGMPHTFEDKNLPCRDADAGAGILDTPMSQGPVWNQSWSTKAGLACKNIWSSIMVADYDLANQQASVRVGIPTAEATAGFDSCNADSLNDELANYITYTYDVCLLATGHLTSGQIAAMHRITANTNPTMYAWGQYYAQNPPVGIQPSYVVAPSASPPPPPSPPPPSNAPCVTKADGGCMCKPRWQALSGAWFDDCTTTPDTPKRGTWCAVDLSGNCAAPKNGWWDTCTKATTCTPANVVVPSPPPSPPPPSPPPLASTPFCGAGAPTRTGRTCIKTQWKVSSSPTTYTGCANPTNDPKGAFCALVPGTTTPSGASWDYCLEGCPNVGAPSWPKQLCTNPKVFNNPTCTCKTDYAITFDDNGKTYAGLSGCVGFEESGGSGMCIGSCSSGKGNNKPITCGC